MRLRFTETGGDAPCVRVGSRCSEAYSRKHESEPCHPFAFGGNMSSVARAVLDVNERLPRFKRESRCERRWLLCGCSSSARARAER
jgi:hypothetical protein